MMVRWWISKWPDQFWAQFWSDFRFEHHCFDCSNTAEVLSYWDVNSVQCARSCFSGRWSGWECTFVREVLFVGAWCRLKVKPQYYPHPQCWLFMCSQLTCKCEQRPTNWTRSCHRTITVLLSNLLSFFQTSLTSKSKHSLTCTNRFTLRSVFSRDDQQFRFTQWLTRQPLS